MSDGGWVWGRRSVLEALRTHRVVRLVLEEGIRDAAILAEIRLEAGAQGLRVDSISPAELRRRAGENAQGVAAEVRPFRFVELRSLLERCAHSEGVPLLLILDQLQDPRNVGSLLRTAEAAGVDGVVVTEHASAPMSGTVAKASAGALHHLAIARSGNLARCLTELGRHNMWTVALDSAATTPIYDVDLTLPTAIVVGSEGRGVRRLTASKVDVTAMIPMAGHIASLNASVAGAIALFEAVRQRRNRSR